MSEQNKKQNLSPRFFFLSLGVIITLITSVTTILSLFFEALTKKFPDVLNSTYEYGYSSYNYDSMRSMLATLIIVFPIFLILSFFWWKFIKKGLSGLNKTIFKWMIYLILFLTTIVFVVDLVILVNYFVSGEITNRFLFKVFATAIVSGLVWASYYLALKLDFKNKINKILSNIYLAISVILFIALIIFSFKLMGSPAKQRALRLDENRITDLQSIQWQVISYYQNKNKLPLALNDLKDPLSGAILPVDPEFEKGFIYEYAQKDKLSFELCATFKEIRPKGWSENTNIATPVMYSDKTVSSSISPSIQNNDSWDHGVGRTCFIRTIDPQIYRPIDKIQNVD